MVAYFLLFLGFFTNFNYVTLENKVNIALTAELQFNQNDIKEIDRVQSYLNEIKKNILRKNIRKYNMYQQNDIKKNELNGNVTISNLNNINIEKYTNLRKNYVKDPDSKKNQAQMKMVNIDIRVGTNSLKHVNKNAKRIINSSKNNNSTKTTVSKQESKDIHIHDVHNKLIIIDTTPQIINNTTKHETKKSKHTTKSKATKSTFTKNSSKDNNSTKTTVSKQESKDIHIHDVHNKLIIIDTTPQIVKNTTKPKTKKSKHTRKSKATKSTLTKNSSKDNNSTKTTVGKPESKDIHIHDVQNKLIILETTPQIIKNATKHKITTGVLNKQQNKSKSTKPPSARKHIITILTTVKNKELIKSTAAEKSKNEVRNITTKYYYKEIKETGKKIKEIDYSSIETNENYNNLDEYLKSKVKEENYGKNKEVLEKVKSDLSNLFSNDKANPTSEKADSFQELEKAFGFDV